MSEVVCQHCQTENEAGAELCVACGQPLAPVDAESPADTGADPVEREEVEQWVRQLPEFGKLDAESLSSDDESLPAWLQAVRAHADQLTSEEADDLMEFLADLEPGESDAGDDPMPEDAAVQAEMSADLPAWVAALLPEEKWPETENDSAIAQHFAEAEEEDEARLPSTAPLPKTRPEEDSPELDGIPQMLAGEDLPDWLAEGQDVEKRPDSEEPPGWPGRSRRPRPPEQRRPASEMTAPESTAPESTPPEPAASQPAASEGDAGPQSGVEAIDAALDEVAAAAVEGSEQPGGAQDDLSGFSDWMDPAQSAALEETLEEMLDLPDAQTSEGRVDQWLDILEALPGKSEAEQMDQPPDDIDLEAIEVPDWMASMRPEQTAAAPDRDELGPPEESGPLAGLRGVIPPATFTLAGGIDRSAANVALAKEQRQQAALLRRLTTAAPQTAAASERPDDDTYLPLRLVLGLGLLLVILVGWLAPGVADLLPQPGEAALPPAAAQAHDVIVVNSGRAALVAFEYTPSMAAELDPVAGALLADLAANDVAVLTVSQVAAGVPMADRALATNETQAGGSLGYLPGEASGLRALGACLGRSCETLTGRQLSPATQAALADVSLIIVLAGDRDSLANWLEQVGSQRDIDIVGGVTQALGPVAGPYLQSEQLAGLVEGLPVGVAYQQTYQSVEPPAAEQLASLTLAQWLVIGALLVGLIYFGFATLTASAVSRVAGK